MKYLNKNNGSIFITINMTIAAIIIGISMEQTLFRMKIHKSKLSKKLQEKFWILDYQFIYLLNFVN